MDETYIKNNQHFWHFVSMSAYAIISVAMVFTLWALGKLPTHISVFNFSLLSLATFRLTRLFVYDTVADFIRDYFSETQSGPKKSMHDLLDCPWCTGIWAALLISFFFFLTPLAYPFIIFLSVAGFGTFIQFLINLIMRANNQQ
ncbi:MAG TPA: DUF1360 domain-containing protein [Patescibacteria group bacterium]